MLVSEACFGGFLRELLLGASFGGLAASGTGNFGGWLLRDQAAGLALVVGLWTAFGLLLWCC